jgi:hypothetical protein
VLRRLTTLLVLGFVLLGTAAPAFACATKGDCCPEDTTTPCGGEGSGFITSAPLVACCVSPPQSASSISALRNESGQQNNSGSPDPVLVVAWLATFASRSPDSAIPSHFAAITRSDGALTYLRTGRLRL